MPDIKSGTQWTVYMDRLLYKYEQTGSAKILQKIYKACGIEALKVFAPGRYFTPEQLRQYPAVEIAKAVEETKRLSEILRVIYDYIDSFPVEIEENIPEKGENDG